MTKFAFERGTGSVVPEPDLAGIVIVIPEWQPDHRLLQLVGALRHAGLKRVVVVDDGSTPDYESFFCELEQRQGATLLRHERNLGKGRALKTAFSHVLSTMTDAKGVVTADADGQHLPEDILRVARRLACVLDRAVLGVRSFDGQVPLRSRLGNWLTRQVFASLAGRRLRDTRTGLRGLSVHLLPELLTLPGERYEYEMVMLAHLSQNGAGPEEIAIQTVYLEGNRSSHFHPLRDSLRVYRALFRACKRLPKGGSYQGRSTDKPRLHAA